MQGKIAIEEHFGLPGEAGTAGRYPGDYWKEAARRLLDVEHERLRSMDEAGIEFAILSLNASVQAVPKVDDALLLARRGNDFLAELITRHPGRFAGLAALPMQDPDLAAKELNRCIHDLSFCGALVNGFSQRGPAESAVYYDLPEYWPFWAEVERLNVPFYLHPRDALPNQMLGYDGHPWLIGSPWGFSVETSLHALRLICSGLFDRFPHVQVLLGHLGEHIPYNLWRIDHRLSKVPGVPARREVSYYFRNNFSLTTSGNFSTEAFQFARQTMGAERILFSVDYPFEDNLQASSWFDSLAIADEERRQIGRINAIRLFRLPLKP